MVGKVYGIPPQPPVDENTRTFRAGAITLRRRVPRPRPRGSLAETYKDNPQYLAELREKSPEGGFSDEGVSIHVCDAGDGHEYLRFDVFDDEPHYHYIHRTVDDTVVNNVIDFDAVAHGDMLRVDVARCCTRGCRRCSSTRVAATSPSASTPGSSTGRSSTSKRAASRTRAGATDR